MLVPLSWLRDFAPFGDDVTALATTFDELGMVVEGVTRVGGDLDAQVVVARVMEVGPIKGADKIRRVLVDDGSGDDVQVVCGAWNFGDGDVVAFARAGASLPGGFTIGRRKMKGVESNGMICSAAELHLGDDSAGILVLPQGLTPGQPLVDALGIEPDVVFDLGIETNRPDANCVAGVARDAAAKLRLPFAIPEPPGLAGGVGRLDPPVVASPDLCPRFTVTLFEGATVASSPEWMVRRLTLAGMRSISNLVDASNYVMLELGQPTHPYDLDRLPGGGLSVRAANPGERVVTLDGVERTLGDGPHPDCLICDAESNPVGIAGIMGGASSEISESTTNVLLEAAYFDRMAIARTSRRIGLRSEASARFERGCDPEGIERAVARYAELVDSFPGAFSAVGDPPLRRRIRVRPSKVNALLGSDLSEEQIVGYVTPIGFEVDGRGTDALEVIAPSFRPDAEQEVDVIEEVARHHGYANFARTVPGSPQVGRLTAYQRERRLIRQVLAGAGVSEAIGPMLLAPGEHARAGLAEGIDSVIAADSPLVREESVLRTSLLPGLLRAVAFNSAHRAPNVKLFEVGHVYPPPLGSLDDPSAPLPNEHERIAVALGGTDAVDASRLWRVLSRALRLVRVSMVPIEQPGLHPTRTALLDSGGTALGVVGEVDPGVVSNWGIEGRVGWIDLSLEALHLLPRLPIAQRPVSRFPSTDIDLAFIVDDTVPAAAVEQTLADTAGDLLVELRLFDVYRGEQAGVGRRSLAYRLRFNALDRTLTDAEIGEIRARCIAAAETVHGASLRG